MEYVRKRFHPRVYRKKETSQDDAIMNLSLGTAVGVLAFTFIKGIFWGYVLGRKLS